MCRALAVSERDFHTWATKKSRPTLRPVDDNSPAAPAAARSERPAPEIPPAADNDVPFYVAAPSSTFDLSLASGDAIPIEQRDRDEVASPQGVCVVPAEADVMNPAFDTTPAKLITAIITERGVVHAPDKGKLAKHLA